MIVIALLMFIILFIVSIESDFNTPITEKHRDNIIASSFAQKEVMKHIDNNTGYDHNGIDIPVADVNNKMQGTLIVTKKVINEDGGNSKPSDFIITVHGNNPSPSSFLGNSSGTIVKLVMGMYSVTESGPSDYNSTSSMDCSGASMSSEVMKCNITSTYVNCTAGNHIA